MPLAFANVQTTGDYTTTPAVIEGLVDDSAGGFAVVSSPCLAQIQYGPSSSLDWGAEFEVPSGGLDIDPDASGIRFRTIPGALAAIVSAAIFRKDEPALRLSGLGSVTVQGVNVTFQHNAVAAGAEPILDLEDTAGEIVWTLTDDVPNTAMHLSAGFTSPAIFPGDVITGTSAQAVGGGPGTQMHSTGTFAGGTAAAGGALLTGTVAGDAVDYRFRITADGTITWGDGAHARDTTFGRLTASVVGNTNTAISTGPLSGASGGGGVDGVYLTTTGTVVATVGAVTNGAFTAAIAGDTTARYIATGDGTLKWGTGAGGQDSDFGRMAAAVVGSTDTGLTTGPTSTVLSGAQTAGTFIESNGQTLHITASSLDVIVTARTTDTVRRFSMNDLGLMQWGPGGATNQDTTLNRVGAGRLALGTTTQDGRFDLISGGTTNTNFSVRVTTDANTRLLITGDGTVKWGDGSVAPSVSLAFSSPGQLALTGGIVASDRILSSSSTAGIGYQAGSGGSVTQVTSKSTGVTLNTVNGVISTSNAALAAGASVSFVLTNSTINQNDVLAVCVSNGRTGYRVEAMTNTGINQHTIRITNVTAGSLSEIIAISFAVIRAQAA